MNAANGRWRWLAAIAALVVLVVGVPAILVLVAGWPFPGDIPEWSRVTTALEQGDIPAEAVIKTLAVIVWIAWVQLLWALAWEFAVNLRRLRTGRFARPAPAVPSIINVGAARLVAIVLSIGLTIAATSKPALSRPQLVALPSTATPAAAVTTSRADSRTPTAPTWIVAQDDTLWDIAERTLGDGSRAGEILELNPAVRSARDLRVGQHLRLPSDAITPTQTTISTSPAAPAADAEEPDEPFTPETVITVVRGDNLWSLSAARLRAATGQQSSPGATLDYLHAVEDANRTTIHNPDLIFPGERLVFPAIGTPPSEPTPATPPAGDQPAAPAAPMPTTPTTIAPNAATEIATTATPPPATLPTASAPADNASRDHGSAAPWLAVLAGATVLASGVVLTQRRLRDRAAVSGARRLRVRPLGPPRELEGALVAASDIPLVRWANHELALLAAQLKPGRTTTSPVAVEVSAMHGLELLWNEPNPAAPTPWEAFDSGWAWRRCYDADVAVPSTPEPAVIPGLVTIGERDANTVLLDLEAFGSVAIVGDPTRAEDLARSMITELAYGDEFANTYLHLIEFDVDGLRHSERVRQPRPGEALDLLHAVSDDHARLLEREKLSSTFQLRLGGAAVGREVTVVIARAAALSEPAEFVAAAQPHRGVALILVGDGAATAATIHVDDGGHAVIQPLGLSVHARQLPALVAENVADLLRDTSQGDAETALDDIADTPSSDIPVRVGQQQNDALALDDEADDDWALPVPELLIRVLGVPRIEEYSELGRIELNVVTFLACNAGQATESQLIDAVWNGRAIERATLWNRISKARAILGRFIPARDQSSNVRLADGVVTDVQILRWTVDAAGRLSATQALHQLGAAVDLVQGVPFDAVGYDWAHEHQHYADACELVERATLTMVDLALELDDVTAARHAVSQGLKALRVNEPLYRARMQVEAHCGNRAGIRAAYDELASLLQELADGPESYTPSATTTAVLNELLQTERRTA
jgi:hypothetical protein